MPLSPTSRLLPLPTSLSGRPFCSAKRTTQNEIFERARQDEEVGRPADVEGGVAAHALVRADLPLPAPAQVGHGPHEGPGFIYQHRR